MPEESDFASSYTRCKIATLDVSRTSALGQIYYNSTTSQHRTDFSQTF